MALRCVQLCNENYVNGVEQQLHQLGGIGGDNTHAGTAVAAIAVDPHRRYVAAHNGMNGVNVYLLQDVLDPLRRRTRPCDDQAVHTELVPYQQIHTDAPVVALAFAGGECSSRPIAAAPKRYRLHNYRRKTVLVVCTRNTVRLYDVSEMDYSGVGSLYCQVPMAMAVCPRDYMLVAVADHDCCVHLYDLNNDARSVCELNVGTPASPTRRLYNDGRLPDQVHPTCVAFAGSGDVLAVGTSDNRVIIYNRQSTVTEGQAPFAEVHTLDGHENAITSVDFSPVSDRLLCSASLDTHTPDEPPRPVFAAGVNQYGVLLVRWTGGDGHIITLAKNGNDGNRLRQFDAFECDDSLPCAPLVDMNVPSLTNNNTSVAPTVFTHLPSANICFVGLSNGVTFGFARSPVVVPTLSTLCRYHITNAVQLHELSDSVQCFANYANVQHVDALRCEHWAVHNDTDTPPPADTMVDDVPAHVRLMIEFEIRTHAYRMRGMPMRMVQEQLTTIVTNQQLPPPAHGYAIELINELQFSDASDDDH